MYVNNSILENNIRYKLNEAKERRMYADKSWLGKALSFPARATRKAKVEYLFGLYSSKLRRFIDERIDLFNKQLPIRLKSIKNKADEYIKDFEAVKNKYKPEDQEYKIEIRKLANFNQNYLSKEQIYSGQATKHIESDINEAMSRAKKELEDIINNVGEHLKIDFSKKTKQQLLERWDKISAQIYEESETKKLQMMENSDIKEIEDLKAKIDALIDGGRNTYPGYTTLQKQNIQGAQNTLNGQLKNFFLILVSRLKQYNNEINKSSNSRSLRNINDTGFFKNAAYNGPVEKYLRDKNIIDKDGKNSNDNISLFCDLLTAYINQYFHVDAGRIYNQFAKSGSDDGTILYSFLSAHLNNSNNNIPSFTEFIKNDQGNTGYFNTEFD